MNPRDYTVSQLVRHYNLIVKDQERRWQDHLNSADDYQEGPPGESAPLAAASFRAISTDISKKEAEGIDGWLRRNGRIGELGEYVEPGRAESTLPDDAPCPAYHQ